MQSVKTDQTVQMHRLIRVFTGRTSLIVGFVMHCLIYLSIGNCPGTVCTTSLHAGCGFNSWKNYTKDEMILATLSSGSLDP